MTEIHEGPAGGGVEERDAGKVAHTHTTKEIRAFVLQRPLKAISSLGSVTAGVTPFPSSGWISRGCDAPSCPIVWGLYEFIAAGQKIVSGNRARQSCGEVILDAPDRTLEIATSGGGATPLVNVDQDQQVLDCY